MRIELEMEIDGRWVAELMDSPGVIAYGQTTAEALDRLFVLAADVLAAKDNSKKDQSGTENVG